MNENTPMIYGLIGKAIGMINAIGKNSRNQQQGFMYRGIDAVYNALNPVMAELGLFIVPEVLEQRREERTNSKGTTIIYSILTMKFTMFAPDGSSVSGTLVGEGMDTGDKASNKAMSIAMKYFCFQTFMIPTEELKQMDPDAEVHEVMPRNDLTTVTTTKKLPSKDDEAPKPAPKPVDVSTPKGYLLNEIAFMAHRMNLTQKEMVDRFESARRELVKSGAIENIRTDEMTMEQAKGLAKAVSDVLFPAGDGSK